MTEMERKFFDFLCTKSRTREEFTLEEAASEAGYKVSTVTTHFSKKLKKAGYVRHEGGGKFVALLPTSFSEFDYKHLMTQVAEDPIADILTSSEWTGFVSRLLKHAEDNRFTLRSSDAESLARRIKSLVGSG